MKDLSWNKLFLNLKNIKINKYKLAYLLRLLELTFGNIAKNCTVFKDFPNGLGTVNGVSFVVLTKFFDGKWVGKVLMKGS